MSAVLEPATAARAIASSSAGPPPRNRETSPGSHQRPWRSTAILRHNTVINTPVGEDEGP
jgi:hypothetical protein